METLKVTLRCASGHILTCQSWSAFILVGKRHGTIAHNNSVVLFNGHCHGSLHMLKHHLTL